MADIKTDFLSLNYSPSFSVEGIQEAGYQSEPSPCRSYLYRVWCCYR